jgi:hypothetical protein
MAGVLIALAGPLLLAAHRSGHAHEAPTESSAAGVLLVASTADRAATPCALCEFLAGSQRTAVLASVPFQALLPAPPASAPIVRARPAPASPDRSLENPRAPPIAH